MPSPFPGMDPYLEHPAIWPDVHQGIITYTRDHLRQQLGPGFYLSIGERVYVEFEERGIYPDVAIIERPRGARAPTGTATAPVADTPRIVHYRTAVERREVFLELRDASRGHRIVTVIEVVSPANKRRGPGRDLYVQKQEEVLASDASLVEIDLLRGADRVVAPTPDPLDKGPYRVVVSRAGDRLQRELYSFDLRERLPRVGIPVVPGVADVVLDLPAILAEAYEKGSYEVRVDYTRDPVPPLERADADWARELLTRR